MTTSKNIIRYMTQVFFFLISPFSLWSVTSFLHFLLDDLIKILPKMCIDMHKRVFYDFLYINCGVDIQVAMFI